MLSPLTRLGRYELVARLAVGGMAEVFLARHGELSGFKTLVVVKKVLPNLAENPEFISMFLDEARIASLLDHPNVVRIVEVGRAANDYFLAMELVQGKPLASLVRRAIDRQKPLDPKLAALIVAHACQGLHHAHGVSDSEGRPLGLVHRDVSPKNVLISFEGSVKVIDFGIARAMGRLSETSTGGMKGTVGYMSPEQAKSEVIDRRSDIFAAGVVLWEALCCRRLFKKDNDFASMRALIYEPIPTPTSVVPSVPPALEQIVMKALNRDPRARFQTALEMSSALERFIGDAGGASTSDLSTLMKEYFATDQADWKNLIRTAHEMKTSTAPIESPIKMTATGVTALSAENLRQQQLARGSGSTHNLPRHHRGLVATMSALVLVVTGLLVTFLVLRSRSPQPGGPEARMPAAHSPAIVPSEPPPPPAEPPPATAPPNAPPKMVTSPPSSPTESSKRHKPKSRPKTPKAPAGHLPNPFE